MVVPPQCLDGRRLASTPNAPGTAQAAPLAACRDASLSARFRSARISARTGCTVYQPLRAVRPLPAHLVTRGGQFEVQPLQREHLIDRLSILGMEAGVRAVRGTRGVED